MAVEEKLSDALHERLTQRFVDRRTSVLMRDLGKKGAGEFPVLIDAEGEVSVGSYAIGRLQRLRLRGRSRRRATPTARCCSPPPSGGSAGEYEKRAAALVADTRRAFRAAHRGRAAGRDPLARPRGGAARPRQESALARASSSTGGSTGSPTRAARR